MNTQQSHETIFLLLNLISFGALIFAYFWLENVLTGPLLIIYVAAVIINVLVIVVWIVFRKIRKRKAGMT
ncbi:MAG: hypothetical protein ACOC4M_16085 [Promethearchaeia archaeon]